MTRGSFAWRVCRSLLLATLTLLACSRNDAPAPGPPPAATTSEVPPAPPRVPSAPRHSNAVPPLRRARCRAIAVTGALTPRHTSHDTDAGSALLTGSEVDDEGWLALAKDASLTVKDPRTTRETALTGPGEVRACVERHEETWLARGTVDSSPGAGEVPGSEEWIVTPFGVVRYAAARVTVRVGANDATVTVAGGAAHAYGDAITPAGDAAAPPVSEGWAHLDGGGRVTMKGPPLSLEAARAAVGRCETVAKEQHDLDAKIVSLGAVDASALADLAPADVAARARTRGACETARLRVDLLPSGQAELVARIATATDMPPPAAP